MAKAGKEIIWYRDPSSFFRHARWTKFFPTSSMTTSSQLNAVLRFCIYYSVIMISLTKNVRHLAVGVGGAAVTAAINELAYKGGRREVFFSDKDRPSNKCEQPSADNPYMNRRAFDSNDKPPACKQWAMGTKSEDVMGEPIQDSPFQRPFNRFYTMPVTTPTNSQNEFANWLYGSMPSKADATSPS